MNIAGPPKVDLAPYTNRWWSPGRRPFIIFLWRAFGSPLLDRIPSEPYFERFFNDVKAALLRLFGARIGKGLVIRSRCTITCPWNLRIGDHVWIGYGSELYALVPITIGNHCCVSQNAFLCAGSHDASDPYMGLIIGEIRVGDGAWISANTFVMPGVTIGEGCVVGVGSVVTRDLPPMMICSGVPCKPMRPRVLRDLAPGEGGGLRQGDRLIPPAELGDWTPDRDGKTAQEDRD